MRKRKWPDNWGAWCLNQAQAFLPGGSQLFPAPAHLKEKGSIGNPDLLDAAKDTTLKKKEIRKGGDPGKGVLR